MNTAEQHGLPSHDLSILYIVNRGSSIYSYKLIYLPL